MKKQLLTLLVALTTLHTIGQTKKVISKLPPVTNGIERDALNTSMAVLTRGKPISYEASIELFNDILSKPNTPALIKKNKILLSEYLKGSTYFGESQSDRYNTSDTDVAFDFYSFNNQNVFLQGGIMFKYSLNTLKLNADERAATVVKESLLPGLANFRPLLASPDISYFCLVSGYIARDFSEDEDSIAYKDGESVAIVISKANLKKYINAEITDDEVFKLASFYNANKSTKGIRKITIK